MGIVAAVVAAIALASTYLTWTAERIDRLNVRIERADATLDAQLVRRSAAAEALAAHALSSGLLAAPRAAAVSALAASARQPGGERWSTENALTVRIVEAVLEIRRALDDSAHDGGARRTAEPVGDERVVSDLLEELAGASQRVDLARSFYNQAVRDTRELRHRLAPRLLRLAGHAVTPPFVDIDDTTLPSTEETPLPAAGDMTQPPAEHQRPAAPAATAALSGSDGLAATHSNVDEHPALGPSLP